MITVNKYLISVGAKFSYYAINWATDENHDEIVNFLQQDEVQKNMIKKEN